MAIVSTGQITITDQNDYIFTGTTPPRNPIANLTLWIDTSTTPAQQKRWTGSAWDIINEVKIGDRNLLKNSNPNTTGSDYSIFNGTYGGVKPIGGKEYVVTLKGKFNEAGPTGWYLNVYDGVGHPQVAQLGNADKISDDIWQKKITFPIMQGEAIYTLVYQWPLGGRKSTTLEWVKITEGNKSSATWTPAPEDTETAINSINSKLSDISNDNKLTPGEKPAVKKEWDAIYGEYERLIAQADSLSVSRTVYTGIYGTLSDYLAPLIANLATTSDIVGSTFRNNFTNYYNARTDLQNALTSIEVGARNLIFGTNKDYVGWYILGSFVVQDGKLTDNNNYYNAARSNSVELNQNETYTLSFDAVVESGSYFAEISKADDHSQLFRWAISNGANKAVFTASSNQSARLSIFATVANSGAVQIHNICLVRGNKSAGWSPAPEDVQAAINAAQNAANTANQSVSSLNTYVDGAFKDGVIDSAEAKAIEKYINTVNTEYDNAISSYNVVANNSYLEGTPKTTLINEKETLAGAKDSLMSAINTAISDGKTTVSEKAAVDAAYASYKSAFGSYSTALENANKAIQQKLDSLSTDKVNAIEVGGANLIYGVRNGGYQGDTGIYSDTFDKYTCSQIIDIEPNTDYILTLKNGVGCYILFWDGNTYIGLETAEVSRIINTGYNRIAFDFYKIPVNTILYSKEQFYNDKIKFEKGNKATDWTPAPEDVQAEIDNIQIGGRNLVLNSNNRIEVNSSIYWQYIMLSEKLEAGETYIISAKDFNITNAVAFLAKGLVNTGNVQEFEFGKPFIAISSDIDRISLTNNGNTNIGFITNPKLEKGNKVTDWTPAPEDTQKVLDDMSSDNKLTAQEKSVALKEWQAIQGEYTRLSTLATQLGVSNTLSTPYTNLANYINPLLSSMTVTSDIVGSTFRSYFTAYYNASTDLQNALTSKVQSNVSNLKPAGKNYLIGSRMDSLVGWDAYGGTMSVVTDAQFGKVVEYSRPAGGGDFIKSFQIDTSELKNIELVYYCIAKPISGTTIFNFGGWQETFTMLNNNSPYRDLGNGWRLYYKVFTADSAIASGVTFGLNSVGGTWRFHSFGVCKGNQPPSDWTEAPEDVDIRVQAANDKIAALDYIAEATEEPTTDISGGLVLTNVLGVKNGNGIVTAGMNGIDIPNVNDVRFWAGDNFANREQAPFRVYEDGTIALSNESGKQKVGISTTKLATLASAKGLVIYVNNIGSEWTNASPSATYSSNYYYNQTGPYNNGYNRIFKQDGTLISTEQHCGMGTVLEYYFPYEALVKINAEAIIGDFIKMTALQGSYMLDIFIKNNAGTKIFSVSEYVDNGRLENGRYYWRKKISDVVLKLSSGTYQIGVETLFDLKQSRSFNPYADYVRFENTLIVLYRYTSSINELALNGSMLISDINNYLYASLDTYYLLELMGKLLFKSPNALNSLKLTDSGFEVVGKADIPAGLGGATISYGGAISGIWGKVTLASQVVKSGSSITITHGLGSTNYTAYAVGIGVNVTGYISSRGANALTMVISGTFNTGSVDIVIQRVI